MNNSGKPETNGAAAARRRGGWFSVLLALGILIVGVIVVAQFIPIMYAILFPPSPPVPETALELSTDSTAYGVDTTVYMLPDDACRLARYYQSQGASCTIAPQVCSSGSVDTGEAVSTTQIARCGADVPFSIFSMRYRAEISAGYPTEGYPTRLRLEREIFWTGTPRSAPIP
jgi:hypothetical protein